MLFRLKRKRSSFGLGSQRPLSTTQYQISYDHQCWKALYRLNHNWIMGQAHVTALTAQELLQRDQHALKLAAAAASSSNSKSDVMHWSKADLKRGGRHTPMVQFKGSVILIVSPNDLVHLWRIRAASTLEKEVGASGPAQPEFWQTYQPSTSKSRDTPMTENSRRSSQITCLALDTCNRDTNTNTNTNTKLWQKVMVGYASGHFSVFEYHPPNDTINKDQNEPLDNDDAHTPTLREIGNTVDLPAWSDVGQIQTASFLHPILTTCSIDGTVSIYILNSESPTDETRPWCRLLHRLYGTSTASPIGIALEQIPTSSPSSLSLSLSSVENKNPMAMAVRWRALLSFGLELYDASWTLRLQEIEFDERSILHSLEIGTADGHGSDEGIDADADEGYGSPFSYPHHHHPYYFKSAMTAAYGSGSGLEASHPAIEHGHGHGRIGSISAISISWPFVVTTHSDNTMNVFLMARTPTGSNPTCGQNHGVHRSDEAPSPLNRVTLRRVRLKFQHLSTLYGHCGAVSSVSIEAQSGRLVSASMDRSIKVWTMTTKDQDDPLDHQLEHQQQERVHRCSVSMSDIDKSWTESGQVTKEEGLGLVWVGSDEEKIVSMNCDGTVKVWQFS
ncbi:hypothetical protein BGZ54_000767 [Gamsiella multidivaricata]|nr:hypothetical protein BGZ54_000767 [Gamsiella multidivaricata]